MAMHTDVAVIGSGVSAVALCLNLIDLLPPTATVSLVGLSEKQGKGIAYSTRSDCHLLNVPASRMSLFVDRPDDFVEWLAAQGHRWTGNDFVPRRIFGDYIGDCLGAALKRVANRAVLSLVDAEALGAEAGHGSGLAFSLSDGQALCAQVAALCTGAGFSRLPLVAHAIADEARPRIVEDPWTIDWWEHLPARADILFVGTGLTMIDQCLLLKRRGFAGRMHAVSRRGLLPRAHLAERAAPTEPILCPGEGEVSHMLAKLRKQVEQTADWRAVMDGLRPVTQSLWKGMTVRQRSRFLRHAGAFWNVHRHRMAPAVAAEVDALRHAGQLVVHRGRLSAIKTTGGTLVVDIAGRQPKTLSLARVVNCAGLERCSVAASPLLSDLGEKGFLCPELMGLGIAVDEDSAVLSIDGDANAGLYAMGALTAGRHWEITALPNIRIQARSVAQCISARIPGR